jgi:hypothetical protein
MLPGKKNVSWKQKRQKVAKRRASPKFLSLLALFILLFISTVIDFIVEFRKLN